MPRNATRMFLVIFGWLVASAALMGGPKIATGTELVPGKIMRLPVVSYYGDGDGFHGGTTANCERFSAHGFTVAVPPKWIRKNPRWLGARLVLINPKNGRSLVVRVNDSGSFSEKYGRDMDVSSRIAELLDFKEAGTASLEAIIVFVPARPQYGNECREKEQKKRRKN